MNNKKNIDTFLDDELKKGRITATEIYEREEFELKRKIDTMFAGVGFILIWMLLIIIYGLFF